jgi:hypothetical protein
MTWTKEGGNTKSIVKLEMQIIANIKGEQFRNTKRFKSFQLAFTFNMK